MLSLCKRLVFLKSSFEWLARQLISARCQYESSLAKSLSTGADDGTLVLYLTNTLATTGYFLSCLSSCDGSLKNWRASTLHPESATSESWVMHTKTVEVFSGISFVIGLWSATTFPKLSDFSRNKSSANFLNHQWCREPSDLEVRMSNSGHNRCFHFVVLTHIIKIQNVTTPFL